MNTVTGVVMKPGEVVTGKVEIPRQAAAYAPQGILGIPNPIAELTKLVDKLKAEIKAELKEDEAALERIVEIKATRKFARMFLLDLAELDKEHAGDYTALVMHLEQI